MMIVYLLFLLTIIVTCQANEVSWSTQLNAYSGHTKNDLNQAGYLYEGGSRSDRSIGRTAYDGSTYVVRTRDINDDVSRAGNPSRGDNVRTPPALVPTRNSQTPNAWRVDPNKGSDVARASDQPQGFPEKNHKAIPTRAHNFDKEPNERVVWNRARFDSDGHVVRQTRSLPLEISGVNQAKFDSRINKLGQGANILSSSDLNRARSYGQENYLNRAYGLSQADYARRNLGSPISVARARNNLNNIDDVAQGINVEGTSYFDSSAPIVGAGNYGQYNWIYKPKPDANKSKPKNDIITADSIRPEAQINRPGYSHPDPEIECKQREQYVPSLLDIAERSAIEDSNNNGRDINTKGINLSSFDPNDDYSLISDTYGNLNDSYHAPYDGYGITDGSEILNQGPNNGYGGLNYNMLAPDFDSFSDSEDKSITKKKITNSALPAAYNDSTDQNIYNNTDEKTISDRGRFFDGDNGYTVDHHGFHNTGTLFTDDSTEIDDTRDVVGISSNKAPINSYGECYCNTNNGNRVCNCDSNHCDCHFEPCRPKCGSCGQRESSCERKQSCGCECNCYEQESSCCRSENSCCKHSSSSSCKHNCHSCKPKKPSCNNCEFGQDFGNNYGDTGNNYYGENGIHYYGENGNNHYSEDGNNAYNDYYNNYYKNHAAETFDGSNDGQFHANIQGNEWAGAYAGGGDQMLGRGNSGTEQSGSSGGTVALYSDIDLDDGSISISKSSNAGSSMSGVAGGSKSKSTWGNSIKSTGGSISSGSGSVKTSGSKSSSSVIYSGSTSYGGNPHGPVSAYKHLFSSFSKTGIFPDNPMMGPFGRYTFSRLDTD